MFKFNPVTGELDLVETVDTDGTLAANSDVRVASQKATKTYVDAHSGGGGFTWPIVGKFRTPVTYSGPQTLATNDVLGGIILYSGSGFGSDVWTTPTAAALVAAVSGVQVGQSAEFITQTIDASGYSYAAFTGGVGVTVRDADGGGHSMAGLADSQGNVAARIWKLVFTNVSGGSEAVTIY